MEHKIKELVEVITNTHTKKLVQANVKDLYFKNEHLVIYVNNAGSLHELEGSECDHHLQNAMENVYGNITYELKLWKEEEVHDRENAIPHNVNK